MALVYGLLIGFLKRERKHRVSDPMNKPPLPHLTGEKVVGVYKGGNMTQVMLTGAIMFLIGSGFMFALGVFAWQMKHDWFVPGGGIVCGTMMLVTSLVSFKRWLSQREEDAGE